MSRTVLGIDIRGNSVTGVLLKSGLKTNRILSYARFEAPRDVLPEENRLADVLKRLTTKIPPDDAICAVSIPSEEVYFRNISVPFKDRNKIRQMLPFELETVLPFGVGEMVTDFYCHLFGNSTQLLAATVERSSMEKYLSPLFEMGIHPELVIPGGLAVPTILAKFGDMPDHCMAVDLEDQIATQVVLVSGRVHLIRSCPLNRVPADVEKALSSQINETLMGLEDLAHIEISPEALWVTGTGASEIDMSDLSKRLDFPVRPVHIARDVKKTQVVEPEPEWANESFDNALGIALIQAERIKTLDLRRGPFAPRHPWREYRKPILRTGILVAAVGAMLFINLFFQTRALEKRISSLNQEMETIYKTTFPDSGRIQDPLLQMRVKIQEARKSMKVPDSIGGSFRGIDILNQISQSIPKSIDVTIERMVIDSERAQITGTTETFNEVNEIKRQLEPISFFEAVEISSANIDRTGNRVRFKIVVALTQQTSLKGALGS